MRQAHMREAPRDEGWRYARQLPGGRANGACFARAMTSLGPIHILKIHLRGVGVYRRDLHTDAFTE